MTASHKTPRDLARAICDEIRKQKQSCPSLATVTKLVDILYFASLKTEEGELSSFDTIWLDPQNPDPFPPPRIRNHRWCYTPFQQPILLTVNSLVKLTKASDLRTSSFVIYPDERGELYIWGMVDQANVHHDYVNFDTRHSTPRRPGLFHVNVIGMGHIVAYFDIFKIAELRINVLITQLQDILSRGVIREKLRPAISSYVGTIKEKLDGTKGLKSWTNSLQDEWTIVLSRILLRMQRFKHGGALLSTPDKSESGLNVKYRIHYPRPKNALEKWAVHQITFSKTRNQIFDDYLEKRAETIPRELYIDQIISEGELRDSESEIDGIVWFVSLLSRVDGLVLLNPDLEVNGFGVEITFEKEPKSIYIANDLRGRQLSKFDYKHFGTRHRSMMRYCLNVKDSIGFVVS